MDKSFLWLRIDNKQLSVHPSDAHLQHHRKRHPEEIRKLDKGDPSGAFPRRSHHPQDRAKDDQNIEKRKDIVAQAELDRRKEKICNEVDGEW